jgi:hypothetical protein
MATTPDETTDPWRYGRPSWVPSIEEYRTPGQDWSSFLSQQQPFWSTRVPMRDVGENLMARYMISAPYMAEQSVSPTFSQYIGDYPQTTGAAATYPEYGFQYGADPGQALSELRRRAEEAAQAAVEAPGPYLAGIPQGELGSQQRAEWNRRAWLAAQFGEAAGSQASAENQRAVANLLALRKPEEQGGGMYRGRMADAIRGAMARMQQHRINTGAPSESFLDWYLTQTGSDPRVLSQPASVTQPSAATATGTGGQFDTAAERKQIQAETGVQPPVTGTQATTTTAVTPSGVVSDPTAAFRAFSPGAAAEFAAGRHSSGLPPISQVDPRSATYRGALDLMHEPLNDIEREKRAQGLPYITINGNRFVPTTSNVSELVQERDREANLRLETERRKEAGRAWTHAMAVSGGRTGATGSLTPAEIAAYVPRSTFAVPGKGGPVDEYGYSIPPGQKLTERDKELNRLIIEYMDQGMSYEEAIRRANAEL